MDLWMGRRFELRMWQNRAGHIGLSSGIGEIRVIRISAYRTAITNSERGRKNSSRMQDESSFSSFDILYTIMWCCNNHLWVEWREMRQPRRWTLRHLYKSGLQQHTAFSQGIDGWIADWTSGILNCYYISLEKLFSCGARRSVGVFVLISQV